VTHTTPPPARTELHNRFDENAEARATQGYRLQTGTCRTCAHVEYETKLVSGTKRWDQYESTRERINPRCGIGGFSVVETAGCTLHQRLKHKAP
jgi:hypothetical protein